jgi:amino acid transporter
MHAMDETDDARPTEGRTTEEGLIRGIRRWDLVLLVLNAVIGAGIFGLPARAYALSGTYSLFAFLVCGVMAALILLCFAEVSGRFTTTGGPYLYAYEAFGPAVGFQMGWLLWLARLTAFAALLNLWLDYLAVFWPGATSGLGRTGAITLIVFLLTVLNVRGVRGSTAFNDTFTVAKLGPLLLFALIGLFFIEGENLALGSAPGLGAFSSTVLLLFFAFSGFEMAVIPTGESQDPRRHQPFALITGIAFIATLYLLIQIVSIGTLPGLADSTRPLADAAGRILGTPGSVVITVGALVSITGTLNVIALVSPRLPFAMAERRQIPAFFASVHPRFRTPHVAIIVSSATMLVLTIQGSFISSLTISTVIRLVTYAATCAALPFLRRRGTGDTRGFRAPGGTGTAVAAAVLCLWLITTAAGGEIRLTLLAAGAGFGLYFLFRERSKPGAETPVAPSGMGS